MTRVATLDPELWTDLFLSNRAMLDGVLTRLIDRLSGYRDAIRSSDAAKLKALLAEGRAAKGELRCRLNADSWEKSSRTAYRPKSTADSEITSTGCTRNDVMKSKISSCTATTTFST
jgi:hypothetical protein